MKAALILGAILLGSLVIGAQAQAHAQEKAGRPLLRNPALLNIGLVCQWQTRCMKRQQQAMRRSLKFVRKAKPPAWKVQLCNGNASRRHMRVDWLGFRNCIRNPALQPPVPARNPAGRTGRRAG